MYYEDGNLEHISTPLEEVLREIIKENETDEEYVS